MSNIRLIIQNELKRINEFNKMNLKSILVLEKEVLETDRMRKEYIFIVSIVFPNNKTIFDYYLLVYFNFIFRFKVFRCHINSINKSFNFTLKLRNLEAVKELMSNDKD